MCRQIHNDNNNNGNNNNNKYRVRNAKASLNRQVYKYRGRVTGIHKYQKYIYVISRYYNNIIII